MASVVSNILAGGTLQAITGLINAIRGKNPEDAAKLSELAAKYQSDILEADTAAMQAQADVNKVEAASPNMFVAGWRPAIGWICGCGLLMQFVVGPFATWIASLCGRTIAFPQLDMGTLMTLLIGMLGFGGMRTYEKLNNAAGNH